MRTLNEIFGELFRMAPGDVSDDMSVETVAAWDSMSHMTLIVAVEGEYDIRLSGDDIADMRSVGMVREVLGRYGVDQA